MNVNPGELNKKIKIITYIEKQNEDGYLVNERKIIHNANASFKRISGTETVKSGADFSVEKVRFLIRFTDKIKRKMLVEYCNKEYEIEYLNDYEDNHEYIEIWATRNEVE